MTADPNIVAPPDPRPGMPDWWQAAVSLRRDLHRHPELRFTEERSAERLAAILESAGFAVETGVGRTGVVATLTRGSGPVCLLRADMDALPLTEITDHPFRSVNEGIMHACGHDVHMAVVVTTAQLLADDPGWRGTLTIVLQPAEEIPFGASSGAHAMLETGKVPLENGVIFGLHCWPWLRAGVVGVERPVAMASKDAFRIDMHGSSTHAASPVDGRDALLAMTSLVNTLYSLMFRRLNPGERIAFNVGTIEADFGQSIMADHAHVIGTLRTVEPAVRDRLRGTLEAAVEGVALAHGCTAEVSWANEMPPVINSSQLLAVAERVIPELPDVELVDLDGAPMTADDFALFAERIPGLYIKLGTGGDGTVTPLHSPEFDIDERCIATGVNAMLALARDSLASA